MSMQPEARHEARFFSPTRARHGPMTCRPRLARLEGAGRAWAAAQARGLDPPGPAITDRHSGGPVKAALCPQPLTLTSIPSHPRRTLSRPAPLPPRAALAKSRLLPAPHSQPQPLPTLSLGKRRTTSTGFDAGGCRASASTRPDYHEA